jgi:hypothetical protein
MACGRAGCFGLDRRARSIEGMNDGGRAAATGAAPFASMRTAVLIIVAIAAILLGLVAAHHSESVAAATPQMISESIHYDADAATDTAHFAAQPMVYAALAGGCLFLAVCCVIGLAARSAAVRAVPRSAPPTTRPRASTAAPARRRRVTPALHQLSISRT